jgi:hypothetical protein
MSCETNLLKKSNKLKNKLKNLSNKLERCYNTKISFERMLNNRRSYDDMSGIGFDKSMTKRERKRERRMENYYKRSSLIPYATNAMKWYILKRVAPTLRSSS